VQGRWLADADADPVLVINESLARREFGTQNPIGQRIRLPWPPADPNPPFAPVVGVVADLKYLQLDAEPQPEVYAPYKFADLFGVTVTVRTAVAPSAVAASLAKLVSGIDRSQPVFDVRTLDAALAQSIAPRRFIFWLTWTFAGIALLLALLGIYGVMASTVSARRNEIGLRIALGAQPRTVMRAVIVQAVSMTLVGVLVGMLASAALTRFIVSLLYSVHPTDPATFVAVGIATAMGGFFASIIPALKASSVSPVTALRME
jgi:putative ABC transport system permease protein